MAMLLTVAAPNTHQQYPPMHPVLHLLSWLELLTVAARLDYLAYLLWSNVNVSQIASQ